MIRAEVEAVNILRDDHGMQINKATIERTYTIDTEDVSQCIAIVLDDCAKSGLSVRYLPIDSVLSITLANTEEE